MKLTRKREAQVLSKVFWKGFFLCRNGWHRTFFFDSIKCVALHFIRCEHVACTKIYGTSISCFLGSERQWFHNFLELTYLFQSTWQNHLASISSLCFGRKSQAFELVTGGRDQVREHLYMKCKLIPLLKPPTRIRQSKLQGLNKGEDGLGFLWTGDLWDDWWYWEYAAKSQQGETEI